MKFRKILMSLACVFSLATFSMAVSAKKDSAINFEKVTEGPYIKGKGAAERLKKDYLLRLINGCKNKEEADMMKKIAFIKEIFNVRNNYIPADESLNKFIYERFVKEGRELENFNNEDLDAFISILENRKKAIEKYIKENKSPSTKGVAKKAVKDYLASIKVTIEVGEETIDLIDKMINKIEKLKNKELPEEKVKLLKKLLERIDTKKLYENRLKFWEGQKKLMKQRKKLLQDFKSGEIGKNWSE